MCGVVEVSARGRDPILTYTEEQIKELGDLLSNAAQLCIPNPLDKEYRPEMVRVGVMIKEALHILLIGETDDGR